MTSDPKIFAKNLSRIIQRSGLSRAAVEKSFGIDDKTLWRLMRYGSTKPSGKIRRALEDICRAYHERYEDLWVQRPSVPGEMVNHLWRLKALLETWELAGVPYQSWLDEWTIPARVAERFRTEERHGLVKKVRQAFGIPPEEESRLHVVLEDAVRDWVKESRTKSGVDGSPDELKAYDHLRRWAIEKTADGLSPNRLLGR